MITNHAILTDGQPTGLPDLRHPVVEWVRPYEPAEAWTYSHHPHLAAFGGRLHAIWSNGRVSEDRPGQRVLWSSSADFRTWTVPQVLLEPALGPDGVERVLTAAGFHQHDGQLVAYAADYGPRKETTRLLALTTRDGLVWSAPRDLNVPICPNHGPQPTVSGRLIIAGNIAFPYSDDPSGLGSWTMAGVYPPSLAGTKDDPAAFWPVATAQGWPSALCEGSFIQTADGVLQMLLRSTGQTRSLWLWLSQSRDDGATWSAPTETRFSSIDTKFHLGRLPDGRYYWVGNPLWGNRFPLVLALSSDGLDWNQHHVIGATHYRMQETTGQWKGGEYGYPHSLVHDGWLYTIVSRQKEGVEVLRVRLSDL
ncbi:MAG: exo-alpha-sialidase [Fimbriimonadaceae bacterium]|nr:exo-alpha-sialidase [Fimbriimonadaceae bacterium]